MPDKELRPLSDEEALQLCDEVFEKYGQKFFRGMQCRICRRIAKKKNNIELRCVFNAKGNRGCNLVNKYLQNHSGRLSS